MGAAKPRSLLPLLGGLLALFLLVGVALAARSARGSATANPNAVPDVPTAMPTALAIAATAVPKPQPTAAPPAEPSPVPIEQATTLDRLRLLLQNGVEAGQAGGTAHRYSCVWTRQSVVTSPTIVGETDTYERVLVINRNKVLIAEMLSSHILLRTGGGANHSYTCPR